MNATTAPRRQTWKERWTAFRAAQKLKEEKRLEEQRQREADRIECDALRTQLYAEVDRVAKLHTEAPRVGIFSVFSFVAHYEKASGWALVEVAQSNPAYPAAHIWRSVNGAVMLQVGYQYHWGKQYPFFVSFYPMWSSAETLREHIAALQAVTTV
jgi:hypothetical protein